MDAQSGGSSRRFFVGEIMPVNELDALAANELPVFHLGLLG
jgi:hypothetical protein